MNQLSKAITEDKILLRGARQLLTLQDSANPRRGRSLGELSIIPDGAVLFGGGVIIQVGTSRRLENLKGARGAREIDATGRVVMPGFVDAGVQLIHAQPHLDEYESMLHGGAEPQAKKDIQTLRAASARRLEGNVCKLIERLVRHGTTTIGAKTGYGPEPSEDLKSLRVLSRLKQRPLDIVTSYFGANHIAPESTNAAGYLEWLAANVLPTVACRKLARFVGIRCGQKPFDEGPVIEYLAQARKLGFAIEILAGCETAAHLALEAKAVSLHIGRVQPAELQLLAKSSTIAVFAPASVLYHEPRSFASARAFIDSGVAVALASGFGPDSSPTYNMQTVISLACLDMHMTPAEAICAATVNAAHALQCAQRLGCLDTGKQADLVMLNIEDYRELPYYFGTNHVHLAVKNGRTIYHEGKVSL